MNWNEFLKISGVSGNVSQVAKMIGVSKQLLGYYVNKGEIPIKYVEKLGKKLAIENLSARTKFEECAFQMQDVFFKKVGLEIQDAMKAFEYSTEQLGVLTRLGEDTIRKIIIGEEKEFYKVYLCMIAVAIHEPEFPRGEKVKYRIYDWGKENFGRTIFDLRALNGSTPRKIEPSELQDNTPQI